MVLFISVVVYLLRGDPVDMILVDLKSVVAPFVLRIQEDQHAAGEADAETGDVYDGDNLVPPKIADGDQEIISEHGVRVVGSMGTKNAKGIRV
jgi:hypothetical protein